MTKNQKLKQAQKRKLDADKAVELAQKKLNDAKNAEDKKLAGEALEVAKGDQEKAADEVSFLSEENSGPAVTITSKNSRRRAGIKFGPEPQTFHSADLSEAQWEKINADTELKVAAAREA